MINNVENSCAANIFMETTIILGFFHFLWELERKIWLFIKYLVIGHFKNSGHCLIRGHLKLIFS